MKIIIEVNHTESKTNTNMTVEECFTPLDQGMAVYFAQKFQAAIDEMYSGAELMYDCDTCKTIMVGVCPDCGNEIGRVV